MTFTNADLLQSEKTALEQLLSAVPDWDLINRASLEFRLKAITADLEQIKVSQEASSATRTFSGRPVLSTTGILAEFGATATKLVV